MTENEESAGEETESQQLATRLREAREYLNLSQQFVADKTGIPRSAVSDIERGVRKVDSLELRKLARLYMYPVGYFLGEEEAGDEVRMLARAVTDLTEDDRAEVVRFAQFLRYSAETDRKKTAAMTTWAKANGVGMLAAAQAHGDYGIDTATWPIDIYDAIYDAGVVTMWQQLPRQFGAYVNDPRITSWAPHYNGLPHAAQRQTAGHELGHHGGSTGRARMATWIPPVTGGHRGRRRRSSLSRSPPGSSCPARQPSRRWTASRSRNCDHPRTNTCYPCSWGRRTAPRSGTCRTSGSPARPGQRTGLRCRPT